MSIRALCPHEGFLCQSPRFVRKPDRLRELRVTEVEEPEKNITSGAGRQRQLLLYRLAACCNARKACLFAIG